MPFKSYAADVKARHKDEFEACLLYLRDFMQAIDAQDMDVREKIAILSAPRAGAARRARRSAVARTLSQRARR